MSEYGKCPNCKGEVTLDSDFCPHCGILFEGSKDVFCDTHQQDAATGICIICRKLVCTRCSAKHGGRMFCADHAKVEVSQDWAMVFQSTEINDAELVKSVLEAVRHKVLVQNFGSVGYAWDGGGDSPQSRSNLGRPAKVFVPIPEYIDAVRTIEEWQSSGSGTGQS
jgi:hypothetical protein